MHIDRLAKYEDLMELDTKQAVTQQAAQPHSAEYEVEDIIDDTGSRKSGTKSYRVRWKGYGQRMTRGSHWLTWCTALS